MSLAAGVPYDSNELAQPSISATGTLVYSTAAETSRTDLVIADRTGWLVRSIAESVQRPSSLPSDRT